MRCQDEERYRVHARLATYRRRVDGARRVLEEASRRGPLVVSTSWGKDSVALADLAIETLGPVPLLHLAGAPLPGTEPVVAHFRSRTEVHEVPPPRSLSEMIEWLREVGLGIDRTRAGRRAGAAPKKAAGTQWCLDHGYAAQALGMRAEENPASRGRLFRARGLVFAARGLVIACPLGWWTAADVWAYIVERALPYHPMYDCETHGMTRETLRNAGWLSTAGAERGRIAWLRAHYPEQYRALSAEFPQVTRYV